MVNLFKLTSIDEIIVNPELVSMDSDENTKLSLHGFTAGEVLVLSEITKEGSIILKHHDPLYEDIQIVINKPKHENDDYYITSNGHVIPLYIKSCKSSYDFNFKSAPKIIRLTCLGAVANLPTYRFDMLVNNCYDFHNMNDETIKTIHGLNIKTGDRIIIKCYERPGDGIVCITTKFPFGNDEESTTAFDVDNVKFSRYYLKDESDDNVSNNEEIIYEK